MRPNWWRVWAHVNVALVIALNLVWLLMAGIFLVPKFQKLAADGVIDLVYVAESGWSWMPALLDGVYGLGRTSSAWSLPAAVALVGLFEWRVKSQNKSFIRLAGLGTVAVGLTVVSILVGASLALPQLISGPMTGRIAETFVLVQIDQLDDSIKLMERALLDKDWEAAKDSADRAARTLRKLERVRPAVRALWSPESLPEEEMRLRVKEAVGCITEIRQTILGQDAVKMGIELGKLRQSHAPLREAAKLTRAREP